MANTLNFIIVNLKILAEGGGYMKKEKFKVSKKDLKHISIVDDSKIFEEIIPIKWSKDVLNGKKKVIVKPLLSFDIIDESWIPFESRGNSTFCLE